MILFWPRGEVRAALLLPEQKMLAMEGCICYYTNVSYVVFVLSGSRPLFLLGKNKLSEHGKGARDEQSHGYSPGAGEAGGGGRGLRGLGRGVCKGSRGLVSPGVDRQGRRRLDRRLRGRLPRSGPHPGRGGPHPDELYLRGVLRGGGAGAEAPLGL